MYQPSSSPGNEPAAKSAWRYTEAFDERAAEAVWILKATDVDWTGSCRRETPVDFSVSAGNGVIGSLQDGRGLGEY